MKFLIDVNLGRKFTNLLQQAGYDAIFAKDLMLSISDEEILTKAENEERVVITNDKDFGELVFRLHKTSSGVILLRTLTTDSKKRFDLVKEILHRANGKFIIIKEGQIRIRKLKYRIRKLK